MPLNVLKSSLTEFVHDARSFTEATEGCCVEWAWRGRAAVGGPVALGSPRSSAGLTEAGIVVKIH